MPFFLLGALSLRRFGRLGKNAVFIYVLVGFVYNSISDKHLGCITVDLMMSQFHLTQLDIVEVFFLRERKKSKRYTYFRLMHYFHSPRSQLDLTWALDDMSMLAWNSSFTKKHMGGGTPSKETWQYNQDGWKATYTLEVK